MRNLMRAGWLVLALLGGTAVAWGAPVIGGGNPPDPDAEFLQEVGVGSSDA
jgi:hypothetical protein